MADRYDLASPVSEVVRAMPSDQAGEVNHFAYEFYEGTQHLEFGAYYKPHSPGYGRREEVQYLHNIFPGIINDLAWADLELADRNGFPTLSPQRAMRVSRIAVAYATELERLTTHDSTTFMQAASGMSGFHASLLGSVELLDNERATANLTHAQNKFASNIVVPLARRRSPSTMPNLRYDHSRRR